ncbi:right-handed parallel beta-helix repeat-containing protein [Nocardioides sp. LHD-245]|uniref:right-handed parallel beta-helix repeat-containing protein n=1 Tax=Nocardioides sp. LHD-245 TaxID=3051387 RepID=UPI0027E1922F|nr:right-handed parallel beta-helix repeat-containing protein [Nocardioides sp. LHD-245]
MSTEAGFGRRRVLGMAGVAAAGAGAVVMGVAAPASAATSETWLDSLTGSGDESAAIQAAITALGADGGIVRIPPGTYYLGSTLNLGSNVTLAGAGQTATVLRDHANLGNNTMINVIGTSGTRKKNVAIQDLTIRNGTAGTGSPTSGRDGVRVEYTDGFTLDRVRITEMQGYYGASVVRSTNVVVRDSEFYRCAHTMMAILIEVDGITVTGSTFDTVTNTVTADCYTLMTGSETNNEGSFFVRNMLIENNVFLNNPRWEGLDCHGGENIIIRGNVIKNCKVGIALQHAHGYLADQSQEVLRNVLIAHNTIEQGNGDNGQAGISVVGNSYRMTEKIRIVGNDVTGFTGQDATPGSITLYCVRHVWIEDNEIWEHGIYGICFWEAVYGATIRSNYFFGANASAAANANSAAIGVVSVGTFGLRVEDNTVDATAMNKRVNYFVRSASQYESWQIRGNRILNVKQSTPYNTVSQLPVERASIPTTLLVQSYGDLIYNTSGKAAWIATAPKIGYGSLDSSSVIVRGTISSGSNQMTIVSGGSSDYRSIPPGMNIKITGAGPSGGVLNARVLEWAVPGVVLLDTNASTSVSSANVSYQALTVAAV